MTLRDFEVSFKSKPEDEWQPLPTPQREDWYVWEEICKLYRENDLAVANVQQDMAQGSGCGHEESGVFFIAPVDLQAGDEMFIRLSDGAPLMLFRERKPVWVFPKYTMTATINFDVTEWDEDLYQWLISKADNHG